MTSAYRLRCAAVLLVGILTALAFALALAGSLSTHSVAIEQGTKGPQSDNARAAVVVIALDQHQGPRQPIA
jgi:hypothetical protein